MYSPTHQNKITLFNTNCYVSQTNTGNLIQQATSTTQYSTTNITNTETFAKPWTEQNEPLYHT